MPELPEVETIRFQLEKYLVGHIVQDIKVNNKKVFQGDKNKLKDGKIKSIRRFGKVLVFDLSSGYSLVSHIKLTGQFIYRGINLKIPQPLSKKIVGGLPGKHTHVIFYLDKKAKLYYNDVRRLGWMKVVKTEKIKDIDFIKKLGPEPLNGLKLPRFSRLLAASKKAVKSLLMDQNRIGGVGNIYANDALWLAKIDPKKPANKLTPEEVKLLFKSIEKVLKEGIKRGGASELAFVRPDGSEGTYQKHFLVYGQDGKICSRCKRQKIKKIRLGGRGTYLCTGCQK